LGLCDAAGGFYQFLLSTSCRHKSAFILPSAMGGTLFQWRVAPYGLTRNPAGYSRGMQFALKGLHRRKDLDGGRGEGGATSWIDDICMRATTFGAFVDLFERVLSRLAVAGISLKGAKCALLLPEADVLGFVATPHGLQLQKPKIEEIMSKGIPSNPKEAGTFLGAIAFLRRMIPRVSLLAAPMIDACKRHKARSSSRNRAQSGKFSPESFNGDEQDDVNQSWQAMVDHLDGAAILAPPEFDDPNAEFVLCTETHAQIACALCRNPDKLSQMTMQVGKQIDEAHHTSCPRLRQWLRYVHAFHKDAGRPPSVIVIADGEEFTAQDTGDLLAISTRAATEVGCVVYPESLCDMADIMISIGSRSPRTFGRAEEALRLRPALTLGELHFESTGQIMVDTAIGAVILESEFAIEPSFARPLRGVHAPPIELQSAFAQAVARLLRNCGIPTLPDCNLSTGSAVLAKWVNEGITSPPTTMLVLTDHIPEGVVTAPSDSFAWQDRPDRETLDRRHPTEDPSLSDQLSDSDCKIIINVLQGAAKIPNHERIRAADKYELRPDALYRRTFRDGEPSRAIVVPRRVRSILRTTGGEEVRLLQGSEGRRWVAEQRYKWYLGVLRQALINARLDCG
jgi:hypothetical protein